jgi:transposase IS66 family protein/transposase IS66-like protein
VLVAKVEALTERVGALETENAGLKVENAELRAENAELRRRLGMNSTNSGTPTSKESIEAAAQREARRQSSQRVRSADRKPGGQPGRRGSGLEPARGDEIDWSERAEPPAECTSCGAGLAASDDAGDGWAQIWDIPPITVEKEHWVLPRRRCGCCGKVTTAAVPFAQSGAVVYGPNLNAAAVLLASEGNVPVERTAMLIEALLGVPVAAGFVARALERVSDRLAAAGFDAALREALRAEDVLCGDETPVNIARKDIDPGTGEPVPGSEHVITVRTPDERLVLLAAASSRSSAAIRAVGVLDGWGGYLVRDDYAGWHQFDDDLAGVGQCGAHLIRHLQGVWDLHPTWQDWAAQVQQILRQASQAVTDAKATGTDHIDPELLADLRQRYDERVAWGIATNRHRDWKDGKNHPGHILAQRLRDKAEQVWLWTTNFAVPFTNNASERALKNPKLHQKVSGYWHTLATLTRYCRLRSYLISARNHGVRPIDAIHAALAHTPWLPTPTTA